MGEAICTHHNELENVVLALEMVCLLFNGCAHDQIIFSSSENIIHLHDLNLTISGSCHHFFVDCSHCRNTACCLCWYQWKFKTGMKFSDHGTIQVLCKLSMTNHRTSKATNNSALC
jgi:hypothetical protein